MSNRDFWRCLGTYCSYVGNTAKRSPLRAVPVRHAGQSVYEEIERVRDSAITDNLVLVTITGAMMLTAGLQLLFGTPPGLLFGITVVLFLGSAAYIAPRIVKARRKVRNLMQGYDGERAVAEYLETLARDGVRVLHDVVGDGFNVDHVVVAPQGVFAIETKTISKPTVGDVKVLLDGERVRLGRFEPTRNPVVQAEAAARWVRQQLNEALDRSYSVRPVVFFPGWFVERTPGAKHTNTWVLEPKAFGGFLRNEPLTLSNTEVAEIVYFLKQYIRKTPTKWSTKLRE